MMMSYMDLRMRRFPYCCHVFIVSNGCPTKDPSAPAIHIVLLENSQVSSTEIQFILYEIQHKVIIPPIQPAMKSQ